jgi:hypothetical protein
VNSISDSVVDEAEDKSVLQLFLADGLKTFQKESLLEAPPKPLNDGDRARLSDSPEAM